jgi:hypothetical protein
MKVTLVLVFAFLLVGCTESGTKTQLSAKSSDERVFWFTPERVVYASEQSLWLQACANELARKQSNEVRWFNGIGANDVIFMPEVDPIEEIFKKCTNIKPLSVDKVSLYKKWLQERVLEIQSITTGTTRREVSKILRQNGGFSPLNASVYSHIECEVLKVRIEFELMSEKFTGFPLNENDKVKSVSMPYLGLFTSD